MNVLSQRMWMRLHGLPFLCLAVAFVAGCSEGTDQAAPPPASTASAAELAGLKRRLVGAWQEVGSATFYRFDSDGAVTRREEDKLVRARYRIEGGNAADRTLVIWFGVTGGGGHYKQIVFASDFRSALEAVNVATAAGPFGSERRWVKR